ncbi:hypothetical protein HHK36_007364 [Tetracentron sinense]|uniref:Uncharacterized protein n=1 Tax=Tetracentron sinense TaxID=13715 RepID=A0A834ZJ49_TETSI|nr:hypothetical protein HHK36_007364 [Tetracentron sinense]
MAMQTSSPSSAPSAQLVGNAFVEQYYHILHQSPELVFRFYLDSSVLSRPESNGVMTSVTTMQAINDKILSLDSKDYKAEIKTADAQESFKDGVIVLVTGCLTGKDNVRRKFAQSFFLAPQDNGYFVLNDVFRYVEENESLEINPAPVNGNEENTPTAPLTLDPEPTHIPDRPVPELATTSLKEDLNNGEEVCDPSDNEEGSVIEEEVVDPPAHSSQDEIRPVLDSASSTVPEDAPKKSYASILKVVKGNMTPASVYIPTNNIRAAPVNAEQQSLGSAAPAPAPEALAPCSNSDPESSITHEEVEGHSIYIRSLPLNATVAQLEEEFKKFGSIKHNGIQVRSNKHQGFCFGFVEFESLSSMHSAIEDIASLIGLMVPLVLNNLKAWQQLGLTSPPHSLHICCDAIDDAFNIVGSGRGRFSPGRGAFRNDNNFRGRGNFGGGRGYGRNDFGNRGEFSGRARGLTGRSGEGYQRVDQNGGGRGSHQGGMNQAAFSG